jgi:hypothetical protein
MPRALTAEQEAAIESPDFAYSDCLELQLPWKDGDTESIIIRASPSTLLIPSLLTFSRFTYEAFAGALDRIPTVAEEDDWIADLTAAFAISQAALVTEADSKIDALFASAEYTARMRSDYHFVGDLYLAFLGRVADTQGREHWIGEILATSRADVQNAFGLSIEFSARVALVNEDVTHSPDIRDMGVVTLSEGRAQDNTDLSLQNLENTYSRYLGESTRRLYPAPAVVRRALKILNGSYEPDIVLSGFAQFNSVDGMNAQLTVTSDMSRKGLDVVIPVTQRCRHVYRGPGCDSPDTSPTCSRIFDDTENGCASKEPADRITDTSVTNNQPSFGGVPPFAPSGTPTEGLPPAEELPTNGWPTDYDPEDPRIRNNRPMRGYMIEL